MRRRQRRDDAPILSVESKPMPPVVSPDFVPPTRQDFLEKLKALHQPEASATEPPTSDFLARLRALSTGKSLPVPTAPKVELVPYSGLNFDSVSKIELPVQGPQKEEEELRQKQAAEKEQMSEIFHYTKPIGFGLGVALQFMRDHGIIRPHNDDEPILEYRDENGFRIQGKDLFKHQSHIFAGKRPGEKHRQRDILRHRAVEMQEMASVGDTPLHTASALRKTLSQRKQAFIELTGENRSVMPYEPEKGFVGKRNKKRLRLKKQSVED